MNSEIGSADVILNKILSRFEATRVPHAVLVDGAGAGERECAAQLIAKMLVCAQPGKSFCGACRSCRKADDGIHPDIITVAKPDDKKFFAKEQVKTVVEQAIITPNDADKKVFILSEMQFMTEESQNVLLKILEEPPAYTSFVLTAESADSVIGTVLSRVVRLRLGSDGGTEYSDKACETVKNIAEALLTPYEFDLIAACAPLESDKKLTAEALSLLCVFFRDCAALRSGGAAICTELEAQAHKVSAKYGVQSLLDKYSAMSALLRLTEGYPNYTLLSAQISSKLKRN